MISHPLHLDIVAWLERGGFQPRAGEYKIPAGASLAQILELLNSGKTYQRRITIIEGWRSYDVMLALNEAEGLSSVILRPPPEGSVFPDTYYYTKGMDRRAILAIMQEKMEITLAQIWAERRADLPYKSPRELLIMASIIEKETGRASERALVSGVFVNRLYKKMRLQSDPTVAYGLVREAALPTQLTKKDLNNPQYGPVALVQFDAHCDTWPDDGSRLDHGTMFARAAAEGIIDVAASTQVGLRTYNDSDHGFEILTSPWIHRNGIDAAIDIVCQRARGKPVYLSFDIDGLDPAFAPGTGTPVVGGLASWQGLELIRGLEPLQLIGMDVVEVAPAYDHVEITAIAAASVAYDWLAVLAKQAGATPQPVGRL